MRILIACRTIHAAIGRAVRRHMRHHWNIGHRAARRVWVAAHVACVTVSGAALWLPTWPAVAPHAGPVAVAEPSSLAALAAAVAVLVVVRR